MFGNKELEQRVSELEEMVENGVTARQRLDKLEEQLAPEPAFKAGDLVNFFLVGNEFEGEIVEKRKDHTNRYPFFAPTEEIDTEDWFIKYLDKNEVAQTVAVKEEDIWVDECDCIDCLQDQIEELSFRLKALENKKK